MNIVISSLKYFAIPTVYCKSFNYDGYTSVSQGVKTLFWQPILPRIAFFIQFQGKLSKMEKTLNLIYGKVYRRIIVKEGFITEFREYSQRGTRTQLLVAYNNNLNYSTLNL